MSKLTSNDLHAPLTGEKIRKVKSIINGEKTHQATAADLTASFVASQGGKLSHVYVVLQKAFLTTEIMTVDVQVNGVSIMPSSTPQTLNLNTPINSQVTITTNAAEIVAGDLIQIIRDWTTSGGANGTPANVIGIEWADRNETV
jgi:hypothetical protein